MRRGQVRSVCRARQCQVPTRPAQGRGTAGSPSCCPRLLPAAGRERLVPSQGEGGGSTRPRPESRASCGDFRLYPRGLVLPSLCPVSRQRPFFVLKVLLSKTFLSVCGSVEHSACWRRAVSTLWADFVRDKRQRCIQGRTKGKGQRDTQRSSKTGRERKVRKTETCTDGPRQREARR